MCVLGGRCVVGVEWDGAVNPFLEKDTMISKASSLDTSCV